MSAARVTADGSRNNRCAGGERIREFEKQLDEFRNENFSVGTLGALNYIIRGMRDLPGQKIADVVFRRFSVRFPNKDTEQMQPNRIFDSMRVLSDLANRSSVVIYTIDPRGLTIPGMLKARTILI